MKSGGQALFDEVVRKLRLVESDYFDLEYTDVHGAIVSMSTLIIYSISPSIYCTFKGHSHIRCAGMGWWAVLVARASHA